MGVTGTAGHASCSTPDSPIPVFLTSPLVSTALPMTFLYPRGIWGGYLSSGPSSCPWAPSQEPVRVTWSTRTGYGFPKSQGAKDRLSLPSFLTHELCSMLGWRSRMVAQNGHTGPGLISIENSRERLEASPRRTHSCK